MNEVKNIQIEATLHKTLKLYCVENGLVIKTLLEKLIKDELKRVHYNEKISQKK
jgi:hypothetical protein